LQAVAERPRIPYNSRHAPGTPSGINTTSVDGLLYEQDSVPGRVLAGDPAALGQVICWIASTLASPRFWHLRGEWADLQQEVLLRLIESLRSGRFDPTRDLKSYVQAVARYTAIESLAARRLPADTVDSADLPDRAAAADERLARRQLVRVMLERASEDCRRLIRAYFLEEKTFEDIAAENGLPVGTVKSRLARCVGKMHRRTRWISGNHLPAK
jgi:RNA polymerase sigma factor (sigma-70 family)